MKRVSKKGYLLLLGLAIVLSGSHMSRKELPKSIHQIPFTCLSPPVKGSAGRTGSWRTLRPTFDKGRCTRCLLCWVYCPEAVISRDQSDYPAIDYEYCKGCGICAHECPVKALTMTRETDQK